MSLPDFFLLGAPKAGTTALHAALAHHPDLYLSPVKEPKYFLCDDRPPACSAGRATRTAPGSGCGSVTTTSSSSTTPRTAPSGARARRSTCPTPTPTVAFAAPCPTPD